MKKFFSLVLALVMALSLTTVAWGANVTLTADTAYTGTAFVISTGDVEGNYGYELVDGDVYDGAGYTLSFTDLTAALWDTPLLMRTPGDVTIKNLTIDCAERGIVCFSSAGGFNVVIDNVSIENSDRPINVTSDYASTLTVTNSTIAGKVSYQLIGGPATFTDCTFVVNNALGEGNELKPRDNTVFNNCDFEEGFAINVSSLGSNTVTLNDCTYAGQPVTADNVETFFGATVAAKASATHAVDGATKIFSGLYAKSTGAGGTIGAASLYYFKAVAPIYDDDTGVVTNQPSIAYYLCPELTGTAYLVEVTSLGAADVVVYNDVNGKAVFKYLDVVDNVEYEGNGVLFANFGKACDQYKDANYDKTATYYIFEKAVYKAVETSDTTLMVGGKLVPVVAATGTFVDHVATYTYDAKFNVTAVNCAVCGKPAIIVPNFASLPEGVTADGTINDGQYFYFPAAAAPAAGTTGTTSSTVQSAQTFDAGIAMYVGMSVMAAAGSAVVIGKKKD